MPNAATFSNSILSAINSLRACTAVCETTAAELTTTSDKHFYAIIKINVGCAETCRRGVYLLQSKSESANSFLEVCEEICRLCEEENNRYDNESCRRAALACNSCWQILKKITPTA
jgi:hypothetical protein